MKKELIEIIQGYGFPQMMLTRNTRSFIGSKISDTTKGFYNHFCWLVHPNRVASQDWIFKEVPLDDYLNEKYVVKFVTDTRWDVSTKVRLLLKIREDLNKPWYRKLYDPLAIFGQWSGLKWIHFPGLEICSDKAKYLRAHDPNFNIPNPNPTDINNFQKAHQKTGSREGYLVTARWLPEDL